MLLPANLFLAWQCPCSRVGSHGVLSAGRALDLVDGLLEQGDVLDAGLQGREGMPLLCSALCAKCPYYVVLCTQSDFLTFFLS